MLLLASDTLIGGGQHGSVNLALNEARKSAAPSGFGIDKDSSWRPVARFYAQSRHVDQSELARALLLAGTKDERAFHVVYRMTSGRLFAVCLRICGDRASSEDVLHELYLSIWRSAGAWEPARSSPMTWLATIARNRAIDWKRAQAARLTVPLEASYDTIDCGADPETIAFAGQDYQRLQNSLALLTVPQRDHISSAFLDGYTYREIAAKTGAPLGTVKSHIRRGLANLKVQFEKDDRHDASEP